MHAILESASHWFAVAIHSSATLLWLDTVIKATVLLLAAVIAATLLRSASAAVRHRLWCLTFCSLLLLPALSWSLPQWRIPVLPTRTVAGISAETVTAAQAVSEAAPSVPAPAPPDALRDNFPPGGISEGMPSDPAVLFPPTETTAPQSTPASGDALDPRQPSEPSVQRLEGFGNRPIGLLGPVSIWLFGFAVAVVPLAIGVVRSYHLCRRAEPVTAGGWLALRDEIRTRLGLTRHVGIFHVRQPLVPMTCGIVRPVVLLPREADSWSLRLRKFVLLHELAHVKRLDVAAQVLGRFVCAAYWFHPLAWYALKRLRVEREMACDDCVVSAGEQATDYARELLSIARNLRRARLGVAVAMARESNLEIRVGALLDRARSHLPLRASAARLLLLAAAVFVTGVAILRPAPQAALSQEQAAETAATDSKTFRDAETVVYAGQVVAPDGQPVPGAEIHLVYALPDDAGELRDPIQPLAQTDESGHFRFEIDKRAFRDTYDEAPWVTGALVATKDGFGFGWLKAAALETTGNAAKGLSTRLAAEYLEIVEEHRGDPIRLVEDDIPLTGRIIDIDGEPVAGATVRVRFVAESQEHGLKPLLDAAEDATADQGTILSKVPAIARGPLLQSALPAVRTDKDGRFTIPGVGRERLAWIQIDGRYIEGRRVYARTQVGERIDLPLSRQSGQLEETPYYPANFTHVAAPSRPVVGVIRDKDTNEPIRGITVLSQRLGGRYGQFVRAVSDEQGRYELHGLPLGESRIAVVSLDGEPYLPYQQSVDTEEGQGPLQVDFMMQRGLWIEGTVRDATTGEPIPGQVWHSASDDNPNYDPEYYNRVDLRSFYRARTDGRFRIPGLPGRGLVRFIADHYERYPRGIGAETVTGSDDFDPLYCTAVQQIVPPEDARTFEVSFELVPGTQLWGRVAGPEGEPIEGGYYIGVRDKYDDIAELPAWQEVVGDRFVIENYDPDKLDRILFFHRELGLAGSVPVEGKPHGDVTAQLQPAGAIRGRIVGENGEPQPHARIRVWDRSLVRFGIDDPEVLTLPTPLPPTTSLGVLTDYDADEEGRFEIRGLVPGLPYNLAAKDEMGRRTLGQFAFDVTVQSDEVKDLGDVTPVPLKRPEPRDEQNARSETRPDPDNRMESAGASSERITVRGHVVDEEGSAIAGASVLAMQMRWLGPLWRNDEHRELARTQTDERGQFAVSLRAETLKRNPQAYFQTWQPAQLVVLAPGRPPAYLTTAEITDEEPNIIRVPSPGPAIEGRLLDLEGQPFPGGNVAVKWLYGANEGDVDKWLQTIADMRADGELPKKNELMLNMFSMAAPPKEQPRHGRFPARFNGLTQHAPGMPPSVATDAAGRFRISGLGRDRLAVLEISGPGIVKHYVSTVTRDMQPVDAETVGFSGFLANTYYGAMFDHVVPPSRLIEGVVRDIDSGQPIAHAFISSGVWPGDPRSIEGLVNATTDERGRFRLEGMPSGNGTRIKVFPPADLPYFPNESVEVPAGEGLEPVGVTVELRRGVWIEGRVVDSETGRGVKSTVLYTPLLTNKHAESYDRFQPNRTRSFPQQDPAHFTADDGSFRVIGIPGEGVIAVQAHDDTYLTGIGADQIDALNKPVTSPSDRPTYVMFPLEWIHAVKAIEIPENAEAVDADIHVVPGESLLVRFVDPEGRPVSGARMAGRKEPIMWGYGDEATVGGEVRVVGLREGHPRTIAVIHDERNVGKVVRLEPRPGETERTIELEPCATITGRIVDKEGKPLQKGVVAAALRLEPQRVLFVRGVFTGDDGHFRYALPPGATYDLQAGESEFGLNATVAKDVEPQPGQTIDLGEVTIGKDAGPPPARGASMRIRPRSEGSQNTADRAKAGAPFTTATHIEPTSDDLVTVRGQVVAPDGSPAAAAKVYALRWYWSQRAERKPLAIAWSRADGSFELTFRKSQFNVDIGKADQWKETAIVAVAEGFGFGYQNLRDMPDYNDVHLDLVRDEPIRGQIVDLEGNPIGGGSVRVFRVDRPVVGTIDGFVEAVRGGEIVPEAFVDHLGSMLQVVSMPEFQAVQTDEDGRFRLEGIGRDRVAYLQVTGPAIGAAELVVVTRRMEPVSRTVRRDAAIDPDAQLYGAEIHVVAAPTRPIVGTIRDASSGDPIAGATVRATGSTQTVVEAQSDENGKYRLAGLPKKDGISVVCIGPPDEPYFNCRIDVPSSPGLEPVQLDIRLHRGVWITGHVTDKQTGEGLLVRVAYVPFLDNPHASRIRTFNRARGRRWYDFNWGEENRHDEQFVDGSFRVVGLPGHGLLGVRVVSSTPYKQGVGADRLRGIRYGLDDDPARVPIPYSPELKNANREIWHELEPEPATYQFRLERAEAGQTSS